MTASQAGRKLAYQRWNSKNPYNWSGLRASKPKKRKTAKKKRR